ncbi:predicted protein [Postia placenta Mad-698-R]|uniref:Uncharacterized protein n=1 Tax=Postia placenta MAD-698-R-SB12 TaxID=670580 RepID=A0A1X6MK52_9APHY|nr:hypothetical protein POSPLADRAFT_1158746 [Postia placenta MAD-698-R-SB12]EED80275.1 predicted protein [Postia placenta Mad-698-R]OSX56764.1 hypothetical protein POSPLADRAFT_1158746 [Postia placenta MAD-698-R-SB12]
MTSFDHLHLPPGAFLGCTLDARPDAHGLLMEYIWRTIVGQIFLSLIAITGAKLAACLSVDYSFRTQQLPILYCMAVTYVLDAWASKVIEQFTSSHVVPDMKKTIAAVFKTTVCRLTTHYYREVSERLGAQVAEGDIRALCVRLFPDLLKGIYNDLLFPQSAPTILAFGCAYAHAAAVSGVAKPLVDLFQSVCTKLDPGWYSENTAMSESVRILEEDKAVLSALPHIHKYADHVNVREVVIAPIISADAWTQWTEELQAQNLSTSHFDSIAITFPEIGIL